MGRERGALLTDGGQVMSCMLLAVIEPAEMGVCGALVELEDGGVLAEKAMVWMEVYTMDGWCGSHEAPGLFDAGELTL